MSERLNALRAVPLLGGLSRAELQTVLRETREEVFEPGSVIATEGATGGRLCVIVGGRAKVSRGGRGRGTIGPGGFFGEMTLIDAAPRPATVRAETDVTVLTLSSRSFLAVLERNWSIAHKVMVELCRRVRSNERSVTH